MNFEKINDEKYRVNVTDEVLNQVDDIIRTISLDRPNDYAEMNNDSLKDIILSRLVASYFFRDVKIINKLGFLMIEVVFNNKTLNISIGKIETNNELKTMAWCMYI